MKPQKPKNTARTETSGKTSGSFDDWNFDYKKYSIPIRKGNQPSNAFYPPDRENYVFKPNLK